MQGAIVITGVYLILAISTAIGQEMKIVCYFSSWAIARPKNGIFQISDIDPLQCTHLIYNFVGLDGNNIKVMDKRRDLSDQWGKNGFGRFNQLRKKNPALKTLLGIGGWDETSSQFSNLAKKAEDRTKFSTNVVKFLKKYDFNGFDINWDYPGQRSGTREDKNNYIELLKVMRKDFDKNNLILSAAVGGYQSLASKSYKIPEMSEYLNFINVMAFDLHGPWEKKTGINAPLYSVADDKKELNVKAVAEYWLSQGCPKEKLILGLPFYGRTFELSDSNKNKVGDGARGPGKSGPYTEDPGTLGYMEICEKLKDGSWNVRYDKERHAPYAYKGSEWIGYDNTLSIKEKVQLIQELDLGGAMVWGIENDDFKGICGEKYPLLKIINTAIGSGKKTRKNPTETLSARLADGGPVLFVGNEEDSTTTQNNQKYTTPAVPDEQKDSDPSSSNICTKAGNIPKPGSCNFYSCVADNNGGFSSHEFPCTPGTCYKASIDACDWK